ncbi:hypothetical protein ACQRAP_05080 [Collinsella sp. SGI.180]|uniref:hypothetical protein n=1 Tax=unclassified Collinsella TaxID=2637548 RepID=UPI003D0650F4
MSSYHCPHCNADLKEQPLFTADNDSYVCDACGEFIYDPTTDIKRCECCDAVLNGQNDYEDWQPLHTCSECGMPNMTDEEPYVLADTDSPLLAVLGVATEATKLLSNVAELTCNIAESKLEKQRAEESRQRKPESRKEKPGNRRKKSENEDCFTGCLLPLLAFAALMLAIILFVNRPDLALKVFNLMTEIIAAALELFAGAFENFFSNL